MTPQSTQVSSAYLFQQTESDLPINILFCIFNEGPSPNTAESAFCGRGQAPANWHGLNAHKFCTTGRKLGAKRINLMELLWNFWMA